MVSATFIFPTAKHHRYKGAGSTAGAGRCLLRNDSEQVAAVKYSRLKNRHQSILLKTH